jgi:putative transposase
MRIWEMSKRTFTPEPVVATLRLMEMSIGQGKTVALAYREAGITKQDFRRRREEYGALGGGCTFIRET